MALSTNEVQATLRRAAEKLALERAKKNQQTQQQQQQQQTAQVVNNVTNNQQTQTTQSQTTQSQQKPKATSVSDYLNSLSKSRVIGTTSGGKTIMQTEGQQLQSAINQKQRQTGWEKFKKSVGDLWSGVKEIGKGLWSEYVTNTDKEKGILDYDKYQMYQEQMLSDKTTDEQRAQIQQKMINEGVIDEKKYGSWISKTIDNQKNDVDYQINQVKDEQLNNFRNTLTAKVQPYMQQASNHYQIDAYTNAIDKLMKQYQMTYDNVVETYDDTRNSRIIGLWDNKGPQFQQDIADFLGYWSQHINEGMTDTEAYKATIKDHQDIANRIVDTEQALTDMQYQVTIRDNFSSEGNVGGTILSQITNSILGISNLISLGVQTYVTNPLEEAKQATNYYDIVEELANLNIKNEADGRLKRGYKTVGSWIRSLYDALPTVIPSAASLLLAGKISKSAEAVQNTKKVVVGKKKLSGIVKQGLKRSSLYTTEMLEDLILLDTTFQTAIGRPITREDAVWNMIPNIMLDAWSAKAASRPAREYVSNLPRGVLVKDVIKKDLLDELLKFNDYGKAVDYYYHYISLEVANGLEDVGKTISLTDLAKTNPDAAAKASAIMLGSYDYWGKVLGNGSMTMNQYIQLVTKSIKEEREQALQRLARQKELSGKVGRRTAAGVLNDTAAGVKSINNLTPTTEVKLGQNINIKQLAHEIIDDSEFLGKVFGSSLASEIKQVHTTVKGMVASGIINEEDFVNMVRRSVKDEATQNYIIGLTLGGEKYGVLLEKGVAYFDALQKELGNSYMLTASLIGEGYDNLFAEVLKRYDSAIQEGQQIGMYIKTAEGYRNMMTGKLESLENIIKQYGGAGLENMGNKTFANLNETAKELNDDVRIIQTSQGEFQFKTKDKNGHRVEQYKDPITGLVWQKNFYSNQNSILLNKYFLRDTGKLGSDGLPIETIGGLTPDQIKANGLYEVIKDAFDKAGFDFAMKDNNQGVLHMYIWSRSEGNALDFANTLTELTTKDSIVQVSPMQMAVFKVSHIDEFVETVQSYQKVNGKDFAKKFKPWFEGLYEKKGNNLIMKKYGSIEQINKLKEGINNNVSLKTVESIAAENAISSDVKYINDLRDFGKGEKESLRPKQTKTKKQQEEESLEFASSKRIKNYITRRDEIKSILGKTFKTKYTKQEDYDKIVNKLTDFIEAFHIDKEGIPEKVIEDLGKIYSDIVTSPETVTLINNIDTKENHFFDILTAKLINAGTNSQGAAFNQAFANYVAGLTDDLLERTGKKFKNVSQYIKAQDLPGDVLDSFKGLMDLLDNIDKFSGSRRLYSNTQNGLMKSIDSKQVNAIVDKLGLVNKEQSELFFKKGITGKQIDKWNNRAKTRKVMFVKDMSRDDLVDLVDYMTYKELEMAGLYDYNLLTQMREGLVDKITKALSLDRDLQLRVSGTAFGGKGWGKPGISITPIIFGKDKNIINLGEISFTRLLLRGSYATQAFQEAITHEVNHLDDIMAYLKGIDVYTDKIHTKIGQLSDESGRKDLFGNICYLLTGNRDIQGIFDVIDSKYKNLDTIAENIWNRFSGNQASLNAVQRGTIATEFFREVVRPIEEIMTELHTLNAIFGGYTALPKNFELAIDEVENTYRMLNRVLNTFESNAFDSFEEFKSVLYNKQVTTSYDNIYDPVYIQEASSMKRDEDIIVNLFDEDDGLNFIANYDINGNKFQKDIDINAKNQDTELVKAAREAKGDIEDVEVHLIDEIDDLKRSVGLSTRDSITPDMLDGNSFLNKILSDAEKGGLIDAGGEIDDLISTIGRQTDNKITSISRESIIKYSTIGDKTVQDFGGGSFMDQINKAFIGKDSKYVGPESDQLFKSQKELFNLIDKKRAEKGLKKFNDVPVYGNMSKSVLPLIDERMGDDLAIQINNIISNTELGKQIRIDADELLVGEDVMQNYYDYLRNAIGGDSVIEYLGNIEIDGKLYKGYDDYISKVSDKKIVSDEFIEKWNKAVAEKINNEEGLIEQAKDIMPLQTFIMSRYTINILSAIGRYTGEGTDLIKQINNGLRNSVMDKLYTELAKRGNYTPLEDIMNSLAGMGRLEQKDVDDILIIFGKNNQIGDIKNLLIRLNRVTPEELNKKFGDDLKIYIEREFENLLNDLGLAKSDIERINQSIGNYIKTTYGGGNEEDALHKTTGRLYDYTIGTAASLRYMENHAGKLPELKKNLFPSEVYELEGLEEMGPSHYSDMISSIETALQDFQSNYIDKWFIHDDPSLMFKETKPYNITANIGIEVGKYVDTTPGKLGESTNMLKDVVKNIDFDGGVKYLAKKNIAQTIDGIPTSNHFDYLQAYGFKTAQNQGKVGNVRVELSSLDKERDEVGTYLGLDGEPKKRFNDIPRKYNLTTNRVILEDGKTPEDFSAYGLLRQLLVNYEEKKTIGIIAEFPKDAFQKQLKKGDGKNMKVKEKIRGDQEMWQISGLRLSYNNIFNSFIGREVCRRLGIEKDFLKSGQSTKEVLTLIQSRLNSRYAITSSKEEKRSLASVISRLNKILSEGQPNYYDKSLTNEIKSEGFKVLNSNGKQLPITIDSYIPTFNKTYVEYGIDEGSELDLFGKDEIIQGNQWISNEIGFRKYYDDLVAENMGDNVNLIQQTTGPIIVKGTTNNGNSVYGILTLGAGDWGEGTFKLYNGATDYYKELQAGNITEAEFEQLIALGDIIRSVNKDSGIVTKFSVVGPDQPQELQSLISAYNGGNEKLFGLYKEQISLKHELDISDSAKKEDELRKEILKNQKDIEKTWGQMEELGEKINKFYGEDELGFETDKVIQEVLDEMEPVTEEGKKLISGEEVNESEVTAKWLRGDLKGGWRIEYGDTAIEKDLGDDLKEAQKINRINGVVGEDGKIYYQGTPEAETALMNGGTDLAMLQRAADYMEYITPQQQKKIATNFFSFSNYDVIETNEVLQGIAGHRTRFMDNNKDALKEAIDNFNTLISDYTQEEKEDLFRKIITDARTAIKNKDSNLRVVRGEDGMAYQKRGTTPEEFASIRCLISPSKDEAINEAVRKIGDVFVHADTASELNPSWSWALQFSTLNEKGGFDDLWMRLSSNEFSASVDYLFMNNIATIYNGKDLRKEIAKLAKSTGASDGKVERFVHDWFGDSLGTSALYKMDANAKSLYRIMKYSPLSPISGTLMLLQSALLGTAMYLSKRRGLGYIMNMPGFDLLTTAKGTKIKINGVEYEGLGWLHSLTRQGDINLNSNTDLGRTFVDRTLDRLLGIVPMPAKMRESVQSLMKGGLQSGYDMFAQSSIKNMAIAQALASNGITSPYKFEQFLKALQSGKVNQELVANILGSAEINYSRFFSNSAATVMSRNRFSRWWLFNCMNNYTILRSDEVIQGIAKFYRDWKSGMLHDMTFGEYLLEENPELKGLMNSTILGIKMGYHFNLMATGDTDNQENLEKYIVDSSDYLSSIPATFFYNILSAPFKGVSNYIDYTNAVGESETFGGAAKEAALQTLSTTMSQFFREGKVINVFRDWLVAYAKTNNLDYANTVAGVDLEKIANGLGRFMLVEGTETYGTAALPERGDFIGQVLLNSYETNQYGKAKTKLNNIVTAEEYLNGELSDNVVNILAYMPVLGEFIKNSITGQGFTFTQAKYNELEKMVDNDQVIQDLYKGIFDVDQYTDASVNRLYSDLIKFDYTANRTLGQNGEYKLGSYDAKTGKDITLNDMKEAVFTKNMLDKLGMTREEFVAKLNKADDGDKKALIKILAIADAAEPGSSRVCLSYLANNYHYDLMKQYSGKDYPSGNDVTEEQANEINRLVLQRYYPDMFVVDKTSWYKAVREYISIANPSIFDTLYKDDDLSGYVNSLGYLDMLMFQFAHEGDVDARYIKNAFSLIGKYVPDTQARVSIMNHTMQTIEDLDTYDSIKTMMKMGVIAGNTDIYDKIKKDEMMQIMNPDLLKDYENFVWGVDQEINQKGTWLAIKELSDKEKSQYKGTYGKNWRYSNYSKGNNQVEDDVEKFAAKVFPINDTPGHRPSGSRSIPSTQSSFTPTRHSPLYFYIKIYEDTIRETSDKLVTTTGKKYPAQTIEGMTYHGSTSNKGKIRAKQLEFPERRRRAKSYSTDRRAGYPGG